MASSAALLLLTNVRSSEGSTHAMTLSLSGLIALVGGRLVGHVGRNAQRLAEQGDLLVDGRNTIVEAARDVALPFDLQGADEALVPAAEGLRALLRGVLIGLLGLLVAGGRLLVGQGLGLGGTGHDLSFRFVGTGHARRSRCLGGRVQRFGGCGP